MKAMSIARARLSEALKHVEYALKNSRVSELNGFARISSQEYHTLCGMQIALKFAIGVIDDAESGPP